MTNEQKRMLRVVAAYNDITEEQAEKAIVADFLSWLLTDSTKELQDLKLNIEKPEPKTDKIVFDENGVTLYKDGTAVKPTLATIETPEQPKVRKKPGRKPKNFVEDTVREVRQAEKMSKDEFVEYFGGKG